MGYDSRAGVGGTARPLLAASGPPRRACRVHRGVLFLDESSERAAMPPCQFSDRAHASRPRRAGFGDRHGALRLIRGGISQIHHGEGRRFVGITEELLAAFMRGRAAGHGGLTSAAPCLAGMALRGAPQSSDPAPSAWTEALALLGWSCWAVDDAMRRFLFQGDEFAAMHVSLMARIGRAPDEGVPPADRP
jgi:hypothetical protein